MGCWHQGGGGGGVECEGHDVGVTIWTRALSAESEVECEVEVRSSALRLFVDKIVRRCPVGAAQPDKRMYIAQCMSMCYNNLGGTVQ